MKIRAFPAIFLFFVGTAPAQAPVQAGHFWSEIAPNATHRIFMASEQVIVAYAGNADPQALTILTRDGDSYAARRVLVPSPPAVTQRQAGTADGKSLLRDIATVLDGEDVWLSWHQEVNNKTTIHLGRLTPDGRLDAHVVKEFPEWKAVFSLNAYPLGKGDFLILYTYFSEQYFSPISDTGDIAKVWALRWKDGKVEFDAQLSPSGRVQNSAYAARKVAPDALDIVWTQDRHGAFGFRSRFATGTLAIGPDGARYERISEVTPLSGREQQREAIDLKLLASDARGDSLALISVEATSARRSEMLKRGEEPSPGEHRLYGLRGEFLGNLPLPARHDALAFDHATRLWRYVDRELYSGTRYASGVFRVHWTDFGDRTWVQTLAVAPHGSAHLVQPPGDCFHWLEGDGDHIRLKKVCRPAK